jgi:hypothetical protein
MALIRQLAMVALVLLTPWAASAQEKSDRDFLAALDQFHDLPRMLPVRLTQEANGHLRKRAEVIPRISTLDDLAALRKLVRATILESISGLPERTPLNACITGTLRRGDYKIVTADLYLPTQGSTPQLSTVGYIGGKK